MAVFTLAVDIQLVDTLPAALVITETAASIVVAGPNQITLYSNLAATFDFRQGEIYRGWDFLYRGWKQNAYDPFPATLTTPNYFACPLDAPYPEYRLITTDAGLIADTYIGFGIGSNLTDPRKNILECRTAFDKLRDYYLESLK